jgi:hypothetical protein
MQGFPLLQKVMNGDLVEAGAERILPAYLSGESLAGLEFLTLARGCLVWPAWPDELPEDGLQSGRKKTVCHQDEAIARSAMRPR